MSFCPGCGTGEASAFRLRKDTRRPRVYCRACEAKQRDLRRDREPLPPEALVGTLQDRIHKDLPGVRPAASVRVTYNDLGRAAPEIVREDAEIAPDRFGYGEGPGKPLPRAVLGTVLCVPDIHFPWHSERGLRLVLDLVAAAQPSLVIQLGDLYDLLSFSRYPRSHNLYTPAAELSLARQLAADFWYQVRKRSPASRCVQLRGNHDERAHKRVTESLPAIETLVSPALGELFSFDGVETVQDPRMEWEFEGVLYQHGYLGGTGRHLAHNLRPTVHGHTHKGNVTYRHTEAGTIWELDAGFLGDVSAPVFTYTSQKKLHGTTLGCGWIDQWGPRFIPFE